MNNLAGFKMLTDTDSPYNKELDSVEDQRQLRKTIIAITDTAISLDKTHRRYKAILDREMKYGSKQAPIGDDNYLHLMRGGLGSTLSSTVQQQQQHGHHTVSMDRSPKFFIRNEVLRNSLTNEKFSQY